MQINQELISNFCCVDVLDTYFFSKVKATF